jgi:hypothetical protein
MFFGRAVREDYVSRQRHEARYSRPMLEVFAALNKVLAKHRWGSGDPGEEQYQARIGCRYERQSRSVLRRGRVLEVIRPLSLTLYETLHDPPCRVRLQLRWRLHPLESGSLLRLVLRYQLNGAATLRQRHWDGRLHAHCERVLSFVAAELQVAEATATRNSPLVERRET